MLGRLRRKLGGFFAALLVLLLPSVVAAAEPEPVVCRVGAYFVSINDIDSAARTFKADFWMWSICPSEEVEPLKTMEFTNAVVIRGDLDATLPRGGQWWATRKFTGTFRQDFALQNYPFDRQTLQIRIEEAVLDDQGLRYEVDTGQSGLGPKVRAPGWRLSDFTLVSGTSVHPTTFGDPDLTGGESRYAALAIDVNAERAHVPTFIKATSVLYITAILALLSLAFDVTDPENPLRRTGTLGSLLFVVVLSFLAIDNVVGPHEGLYLIDQLHVVVLVLILLSTGWSVFLHRAHAMWPAETLRRRDHAVSLGVLGIFLASNIALVATAAFNG